MKYNFSTLVLSILITLTFTGCGSAASPKQAKYIKSQKQLYTQRAVWIKQHRRSNVFVVVAPFSKGATVLPTNSEVVIDGFEGDLVLSYRGRYVKFLHLKALDDNGKASTKNNQSFVDTFLQPIKQDMSIYTEEIQDNIHTNVVSIGMNRAAVAMAIGNPTYPETFSYQDDRWHFSNNRRATIISVIFKDNKVIKVKDIRVQRIKEQ